MTDTGPTLHLYGVSSKDHEDGFIEVLRSRADGADGLFVTHPPVSASIAERGLSVLFNPVPTLYLWGKRLVGRFRSMLNQDDGSSAYMTCKVVTDSEDLPLYRMQDHHYHVLRDQSRYWAIPSWLYLIAVSSTFIEFVTTGGLFFFLTTLLIAVLFSEGFFRTGQTERDLRRIQEIRATMDADDLETAVLVATESEANRLHELLTTTNISHTVQ